MGGRSAYTTAAQPCRGSTRLGVRCRRTTKNPSGWCGECDGSGRDEPPLGRALTAAEVGAPPEPLTLDERRAAVPMGRYGSADEVAATIAFLLSEGAGYITGQNIRIDGGLTRSV